MQIAFSQSGNDSKWFLKKIIFQNRYVALETPPPFMVKTILNFHFDYLTPSLRSLSESQSVTRDSNSFWMFSYKIMLSIIMGDKEKDYLQRI